MSKAELTPDEHRSIGIVLAMIQHELGSKLNSFKKNSLTVRRILRTRTLIDRLRSKLDDLLLEQNPNAHTPSFYYGHERLSEGRTIDAMLVCLKEKVGDVISERVLVPIFKLYHELDQSLFMVKITIADHPEEQRAA